MLAPFALIYTKGVHDINYSRPAFAALISIAAFYSCVRIPYQHVVEAAGHYKQTKKGAFWEAILNIVISVIAVYKFGLIGVSVGTLVATVFRTIQYSRYLIKNIIPVGYGSFIKHNLSACVITILSVIIYTLLPHTVMNNYGSWLMNAILVFVIVTLLVIVQNLLLFNNETKDLIYKLCGIFKKRKQKV